MAATREEVDALTASIENNLKGCTAAEETAATAEAIWYHEACTRS